MIKTIRIACGGDRLDTYLSTALGSISRSYVKRLFDEGRISVDHKPAKPALRVEPGWIVRVDIPDPKPDRAIPQQIPLQIVYEDEYLLVVDKPQGMVVHPAPGHYEGTLVNALLAYCGDSLSDINGVIRPGILHRIDKDTSGLLLVVKDNRVHEKLAARIRRHEIERVYFTLVHGKLRPDQGTVDKPIGRDPNNRKRMAIVQTGRKAVTHFQVLTRYSSTSWLKCQLETGRTHQIRVHLASLGHPIVGDPLYAPGRKNYGLAGQALHAAQLTFEHPVSGERIQLSSPLPPALSTLLESLE